MNAPPSAFEILPPDLLPSTYDNHIQRRLSSMRGQYLDQAVYNEMLSKEDSLLYEVYEIRKPEVAGELLHGITVVRAGKVGDEYFMTKGHFHAELETGEVYYTLNGRGYMVMETPEGDWAVEELNAGRVLYVPPRWAHRSINASGEGDLVLLFIYPGHAGHNYGAIEQQGFRKLVVERGGKATIVDNPRWRPPELR